MSGVTLEEIAEQRFKGWVDFGPEDYCHMCGGRNVPCWHIANADWNRIRDAIRRLAPSEIICPQCFVEMYEGVTGLPYIWELRIDRPQDVDADLYTKVLSVLDGNPFASTAFLAEKIAVEILDTPPGDTGA